MTRPARRAALPLLLAVALAVPLGVPAAVAAGDPPDPHAHHRAQAAAPAPSPAEAAEGAEAVRPPQIPDAILVDQSGREVHFLSDLVADRVVAINFVFTTCTTICPPMGATFGRLQERLGERLGAEVELISVSVDPVIDTPERLRAWGETFGREEGWTLVTGDKGQVDAVLKGLGAFTPEKEDHAPLVLVGNERTGEWLRVYGLAGPKAIEDAIDRVTRGEEPGASASGPPAATALATVALAAAAAAGTTPPAHPYFPETELLTQDGRPVRFFSDLMEGKVVVINAFFASCSGVCPVMAGKLAKIQDWLGERLGDEVNILSITVDAGNDTPAVLHDYAERWHARPGWYFLTGEPEQVELVLGKLGQAVDEPEGHTNILLIGNVETGLWKKAYGMATPAELIRVVQSVLDDEG